MCACVQSLVHKSLFYANASFEGFKEKSGQRRGYNEAEFLNYRAFCTLHPHTQSRLNICWQIFKFQGHSVVKGEGIKEGEKRGKSLNFKMTQISKERGDDKQPCNRIGGEGGEFRPDTVKIYTPHSHFWPTEYLLSECVWTAKCQLAPTEFNLRGRRRSRVDKREQKTLDSRFVCVCCKINLIPFLFSLCTSLFNRLCLFKVRLLLVRAYFGYEKHTFNTHTHGHV